MIERQTDSQTAERQTDRQTDRQAGRQVYFAVLELADLILLSVDGLFCFCFFVVFSRGGGGGGVGGMSDMSHGFGCKATDWLRDISSSFNP